MNELQQRIADTIELMQRHNCKPRTSIGIAAIVARETGESEFDVRRQIRLPHFRLGDAGWEVVR